MSTLSITKTQNNLQPLDKKEERFIPHDVNVSYDDITNSDVSHAEFRVYCAILGYARKYGHLSVSNETFLKDNPVFGLRQFQEHCQSLEEKGFLCRLQHPLHKRGSMRYLIPKDYYERFISYVLKKYQNASYAAKVKIFFEGGDQTTFTQAYRSQIKNPSFQIKKASIPYQIKSSTCGKPAPPADMRKTRASINNINIIKEEENSERGKSPLFFKDYLRKELAKLKIDPQKGMTLYQTCQKEFDAYDNPIAGVVAALKGGYADEKIHKSEEKRAKETQANDEREKKAKRKKMGYQIGQAIQKHFEHQEVREYRVYCDEYHTMISVEETRPGWYFDYGGDPKSVDRLLAFATKHKINIDLPKEKKNE